MPLSFYNKCHHFLIRLLLFVGGHLAKAVVFEERERVCVCVSIKKEEVRGSSRRWFVFFERKERPRRRGLLLSFQKSFLFFALSGIPKKPALREKLTRRSFLFSSFFFFSLKQRAQIEEKTWEALTSKWTSGMSTIQSTRRRKSKKCANQSARRF